jgi:uncharacterized protein YhbP (UPF0306 family)
MKWAMLAAIAILLGGFYWYFQWSQTQLATLRENNAALAVTVDEQKQTITALQVFQRRQNANLVELQQDLADSESSRRALEEKFLKHDLEYLARNRPGLIEQRINAATLDVFRQIEQETGAVVDMTPNASNTELIPPPLAD